MSQPYYIDARAVWQGDEKECARLYRQFCTAFGANFYRIREYYGFKRASMLLALRRGKAAA